MWHSRRKRLVPPLNLVQQLLQLFHRGKQRRPSRQLHRVPAQLADQGPARFVDSQVSGEDFRWIVRFLVSSILPQQDVANQPIRKPVLQPHPFPGEGQIGDSIIAPARIARRCHDLKATVEEKRMKIEITPPEPFGEGHLPHRLARPGPDRGQGAKSLTEIDPHVGLGAVESGIINRGQACPETIKVPLEFCLRSFGARRDPGFRVQRPFLHLLSSAQYPHPARGSFSLAVE